jgi:hypothetical protein
MIKTTRPIDLERSTFQSRPAYRYLRASDALPTLDASRETRDPLARVKLFNPTGTGTWYLAAYDPETRTAYGLAVLHEAELGYIDLAELVDYRGRFGLPIERDLHWTPRPLSQCEAQS